MASQVAVMDWPTGVNGVDRLFNVIRGELNRGTQRVMFLLDRQGLLEQRHKSLPPALARVSTLHLMAAGFYPSINDTDLIILEQLQPVRRNALAPLLTESKCKVIFLNCGM